VSVKRTHTLHLTLV